MTPCQLAPAAPRPVAAPVPASAPIPCAVPRATSPQLLHGMAADVGVSQVVHRLQQYAGAVDCGQGSRMWWQTGQQRRAWCSAVADPACPAATAPPCGPVTHPPRCPARRWPQSVCWTGRCLGLGTCSGTRGGYRTVAPKAAPALRVLSYRSGAQARAQALNWEMRAHSPPYLPGVPIVPPHKPSSRQHARQVLQGCGSSGSRVG